MKADISVNLAQTLANDRLRSHLEAVVPICHPIQVTIRETATEPMPNLMWVGWQRPLQQVEKFQSISRAEQVTT